MKFVLSATVLALLSNSVLSKEHEFEVDYDYYESRNPVDIFRSNKLKRGGKRRALNHDPNEGNAYGYDAYYNIVDSYCVCDASGVDNYNGGYDYDQNNCNDDLTVTDSDGIDCTWYNSYPEYCGYWDDSDFTASVACCACGGEGGCSDNMNVFDADGFDCSWYTDYPGTCGQYDTQDFVANDACCACNGGSSDDEDRQDDNDSDIYEDCQDDTSVTDSYGDGCSWYNTNAGSCGTFDDSDFTANEACCACGGGDGNNDNSQDDNNDNNNNDGQPNTDGCYDDMTVTDSYGDTCSYYNSYPSGCGYFDDDDFVSTEACCACAPQNDDESDTEDEDEEDKCVDDLTVTDNSGYGCSFYEYYSDYCGVYDNLNFTANVACCACAGKGPSNTSCTDFNNATDAYGDDCSWYSDYPGGCGNYDDSDFVAANSCCACGGGNVTNSTDTCEDDFSVADADGFSCYAYTLFPEDCGMYDDDDFTATEACCACADMYDRDAQTAALVSGSLGSRPVRRNEYNRKTDWGCYDHEGILLSRDQCTCHSSCGACAYDSGFPGPNDCISCSDGKTQVSPMWTDGSGTCGLAENIGQLGQQPVRNHEGDGSYYSYDDSYNYGYYDQQYTPVSYVDYANSCLCQEGEPEEFNFFSWLSDFFTWLSSLFSSAAAESN